MNTIEREIDWNEMIMKYLIDIIKSEIEKLERVEDTVKIEEIMNNIKGTYDYYDTLKNIVSDLKKQR